MPNLLCCRLIGRRLRSIIIRFCTKASYLPRLRFYCFLSLGILYLVFSPLRSYHQFNSALGANSLSLADLPPDLVDAVNKNTGYVKPIQGEQPPYIDKKPNTTIPRVIHRTYKSSKIPSEWSRAYKSCQTWHPSYTHYFWTDVSSRDFIKENFEWFLPTYDNYPFSIQRVDAVRYFLLWKYGGIYIDMDISCRGALDPLLDLSAWLPKTWPYGVSNDIMASSPQHPLMIKAALSLHDHDKYYVSKYITVLFTTGPMFLNRILAAWFRGVRDQRRGDFDGAITEPYASTRSISILPPMFYDKTKYSFFGHLPGSTWHGNDIAMVRWVYQHLGGASVLCLSFTTLIVICSKMQLKRRRLRASRSKVYSHNL